MRNVDGFNLKDKLYSFLTEEGLLNNFIQELEHDHFDNTSFENIVDAFDWDFTVTDVDWVEVHTAFEEWLQSPKNTAKRRVI